MLARRVRPGERLSLAALDPDDKGPFSGKDDPTAAAKLAADLERLGTLQQRLFAESSRSLLVVLQAMDAAGKDGVLRHVAGPLDSRGVHVRFFKAPTAPELAHDFLWRVHAQVPARGQVMFFNRSHYEDVLVARVMGLVDEAVWRARYDHINAFERILSDAGTRIVKIYLHISKEEQGRRLQDRLDDPHKRWKFDPGDLPVRRRWDDFRAAYEDVLERCSTPSAPWYVVPADRKWYRNLAVAELLADVLEEMDPRYPEPSYDPKTIVID